MKKILSILLIGYTQLSMCARGSGVTPEFWVAIAEKVATDGQKSSETEKEFAIQAWRNIPFISDEAAKKDPSMAKAKDNIDAAAENAKEAVNETWPNAVKDTTKRYAEMNQKEIAVETKLVLTTYAGKEGSTAEFIPRVFGGADTAGVKDIQIGVNKLP